MLKFYFLIPPSCFGSSRKIAAASLRSGNKQAAYRHIRQAKLFSENRAKCISFLERVEEVLSVITDTNSTKMVMLLLHFFLGYDEGRYCEKSWIYYIINVLLQAEFFHSPCFRYLKLCKLVLKQLRKTCSVWKKSMSNFSNLMSSLPIKGKLMKP